MTTECNQNDRQQTSKTRSKALAIVGKVLLVSFGTSYAHLINRVEKSGQIEGKSSLFVAWGVGITVLIRHLTMPQGKDWLEGVLYTILSFVCSGTPMIVNQLENHRRQTAEYKRRRQQWTNSSHRTATSANGVTK